MSDDFNQTDATPPAVSNADLRQELAGARAERQASEARTNLLLSEIASRSPRPAAEPPIPELGYDPIGHIVGRQQAIERTFERQRQTEQQRAQAIQQLEIVGSVQQYGRKSEADFRAAQPDYDDALKFLRESRDKELEAAGYTNKTERDRIVDANALEIAGRAMAENQSPAARVYSMAKARGYVPDPQKLQRIAAQSGASGRAAGSALTPQSLLKMNDHDFANAIATPEGRALLGA